MAPLSFLSLPPELRFMIYSQLLPKSPAVIPCEALTSPPEGRCAPAILLTCKHISQEAIQCWGPTWSPRVLIDLKTGIDHSHCEDPSTQRYMRWCNRNENSILKKILRVVLKGTGHSSILKQAVLWGYTYSVHEGDKIVHTVKFLVRHFTDLLTVEVWPEVIPPERWEQPLLHLVDSIETIVMLNIEIVPGTDPSVEEDFRRLEREIDVIIQERNPQKGFHPTSQDSHNKIFNLRRWGLNMSQERYDLQDEGLEDKNHNNEKRQEDEEAFEGKNMSFEKHQENKKAFQDEDESGNQRQVEGERVQDQKLIDKEQRPQKHTLQHHYMGSERHKRYTTNSERERKEHDILDAATAEPSINLDGRTTIEQAAMNKDKGNNGKAHTSTDTEAEAEVEEEGDSDVYVRIISWLSSLD